MKVLKGKVKPAAGETTYYERWSFTDDAQLQITDRNVLIMDSDNAGTDDRPFGLILHLADYEELLLVKGS